MKNGARVASAYTNVSVQSAAAPIIKIVPITAQKNPARSVKVVARVSRIVKKSSERYLNRRPAATSRRSTNQFENRYKRAAISVK